MSNESAGERLSIPSGTPTSLVACSSEPTCAGRYDSAFTQKTYVHASDDLDQGRKALAQIHKIA